MMFDLNNNLLAHTYEKTTSTKEDTSAEISGTSSSSSVVNADESPVSGGFDFFVSNPTFVTRELFPMTVVENNHGHGEGDRGMEMLRLGTTPSLTSNGQWLNLAVSGSGDGNNNNNNKQQVRRSRRGPRSRSSQYRGVTFYRRTGRWESHIWDCGKQVYLGGFDTAHSAARAYDRAAIKFRGVDADINFNITDYDDDMKQMKSLNKEEFVQVLRRQSNGFSRGSSRYRGVTLNKCGRWDARMGQFLGKKAYDQAAIQSNGTEAITNFDPSTYESQISMHANHGGDGHNLDLNLGISITINGPKASNNMGVSESQTHQSPIQLADGKRPMNGGASTYYSSGAHPLYGQPMASRQSSNMWSGLPQGRPGTYEDKANDQKLEAMSSSRLSNWAWYMQNQGHGQGQSQGQGGPSSQVQQLTNAASSGFPFSTATTSSTSNSFHQYGQGRS